MKHEEKYTRGTNI